MNDRDTVPVVAVMIVIILFGASVFNLQTTPKSVSGQTKVLSDEGKIEPYEVSIQGSIIDNYANLTYSMFYDNYASATANEVDWFLSLHSGLRLSNISIVLESVVYWGRVFPEQQAIQIYNDSVEANKSAVLVQRYNDGYSIRMNVEAGAEATLTIFVEGLLTREKGLYKLGLPVGRNGIVNTGFSFELEIISNFLPIAGYSVRGLPSLTVTDLLDGVRLEYATSALTIEEIIEVSYALERQLGGAQLLTYTNGSENFFVYLLAPSIIEDVDSARRQYVFVLDKSGSMYGTKITQAKTAFNAMVGGLRSIDIFNVIAFDTEVRSLWTEPHSGSEANIDEAQDWIQALSASGGTNFHGAAIEGLDTFTEGANAKAMLILSDGQPTAGVIQDTQGILTAISEANILSVSIATVAFGEDADENLMANIAAQNDGFFEFIEPDEEASSNLLDFYKIFSVPVADNYDIDFSGALEVLSLSPLEESVFLNGTEIIVAGRYIEGMTVTTSIDYVTGPVVYTDTIGAASHVNEHVEFIWAQQRISFLLDQVAQGGDSETLRNQIVNIGMQYGIAIADYTAIVLTAYDDESSDEVPHDDDGSGTLDGDPYYTPPAYTATPPATIATAPAEAMDPSLMSPVFFYGLIGTILIVLLLSKFRRS
ncbi:MAG: VWA domain-containing protein [Candidatus Thorarchaeota archaeon]